MLLVQPALGENQIEFTRLLHLVKDGAQRHRQLQIDQRMQPNEISRNLAQAVCHHILGDPEAQPAPKPAFRRKRRHLTVDFQHAAGIAEQRFLFCRQTDAVGIARNKLPSQRLFQPLDMLADGRLADAGKPLRSQRETAGLMQHDETGEMMKIEHVITNRDNC